jgi:hypothetical protein
MSYGFCGLLRRYRNFDIVRLAEQGRLVYGVAAAAVRLSVHYLRVEGGGLGQGSVLTAYFGGRSLEKVARILAKK